MDLSYPIGKFNFAAPPAPEARPLLIHQIAATPAALREAVSGLDDAQLDTPYRPEGWTVRQTVHHLADSHMNSFLRFRLALTEDNPTVKPYDEKAWAQLADSRSGSVDDSLNLLEALHRRWVVLLRSLSPQEFTRTFQHPAIGPMTLDTTLALYAWHGRHHTAHITALRDRSGW